MSSQYTWYPNVVWDVEAGEEPDYASFKDACEEIHEAMKGWGTDEDTLSSILGSKTAEERYMIAKEYKELYGETLFDAIDDETSGKYGRALKLLTLNPVEAEARMVYNAMKGFGVREQHLIPLLIGRSNIDMTLLKRTYFEMYNKDMVMELSDELDGHIEKLIIMCAQGIEDDYDPEDVHTEERVAADCDTFYDAGQGAWGTDTQPFFQIMVQSPAEHLRAVQAAYVDKYGYSMKKAAEKELSGYAEEGVLFLLGIKLGEPEETLATGLKMCTKGFGADETGMINYVIRLSCYPDLFRRVIDVHRTMFKKTLEHRIDDQYSGDLKDLLLTIVRSVEKE